MKLIDANWGPRVNTLLIECSCGENIKHPADRWKVQCPMCGEIGHLKKIREAWMEAQCENKT